MEKYISEVKRIEEIYEEALTLLDKFDNQTLIGEGITSTLHKVSYEEAKELIKNISFNQKNILFGKEKDKSFHSSLNTIYSTFDSVELYSSLEEKAVNLLYQIVKNHSFIDGNKRIAVCIFLYFLHMNQENIQFDYKLINEKALVAITIMIAVSDPREKEQIVNLIINLIK